MVELHPAKIVEIVSRVTDVSITVLESKDRHKHIARARFAAYYILRLHKFSYPVIGRCIGKRDHTTTLAGYKKAVFWFENSADFRALIETIQSAIETAKEQPMAVPPSLQEFTQRCVERCDSIKATNDEGMFAQRYLEDVTILLRLLHGKNESPEVLYQRSV